MSQFRPGPTRDRNLEELYTTLFDATYGKGQKYSIRTVRDVLHIPRLTTRSGLRETHERFADISRKLDYVYRTAHARNVFPLVNAVLSLWASMCSDGILCRKLLDQGLLAGTAELLAVDHADQGCLLKLFSLIVRHGSDSVKLEILRHHMLPMIVVLERHLKDPHASEFGVIAVSHCYEAVHPPFSLKNPPGIADGGLALSMEAIVEIFRRSNPSHNLILHGLPILMLHARLCPWDMVDDLTPSLQLFCAMTRSENIILRCAAMWVFLGVYPKELEDATPDLFSPLEFDDSLEDLPADLRAAMESYGIDRCETTLLRRCTEGFLDLLWDFLDDRSLYKFGRTMADILVQGRYVYGDDDIPDYENSDLPFSDWVECMPAAARVLRQHPHGSAADLDRADVLDLEYLIMTKPSAEVEDFARRVMARNPQHAYAHVIFCMRAADHEEVLQVAKDGLQIEHITPYMRRHLLLVLMDRHIAKAWTLLLEATPANARRRRLGTDALLVGLEYAQVLMREAPPDSRDLMRVFNAFILNTLPARGHELSEDLRELRPTLAHLERTKRILDYFGYELPTDQRTVARDLVLRHYKAGVKNWLGFIRRFDRFDKIIRPVVDEGDPSQSPEDPSVERWWDRPMGATLKTLVQGPLKCSCYGSYHGRIDMGPGLVGMYRCASCGATSALVRRCGGCGSACYCNASCQSTHWSRHKDECRR
ncbi:hypothetical protein K466DRAFT_581180 [Polyporus arcularius HHB13444]|uniref:MYND-type domain-containing protein n=1 Tax=Polyporus arcularius HHB13444 TaxID=1314778 RepID=A0A5C3PTW4_9APHY|nr:hypothetical protein K466DRAFT_581180 [Polyporus arcularius HHB13444]